MTYRPKIKFEHRPVRIGTSRIRIGGTVGGLSAEIPDPDGSVWALLGLLDGSRTVGQVAVALVQQFAGMSAGDVLDAIDDLTQAGYVEDAAERAPLELSDREQQRYQANRVYWRWVDRTPRHSSWAVQLMLRQARVVVVGIGGVGGAAALELVLDGVGHVHCIDPDTVAWSNLNRQVLFTEADVGRPKVEAAVARLQAHNSEVTVTGERRTIDGPSALQSLAASFDVILLAADQPPEIRSWTNQACLATGTAWVHGGYHGPEVGIGLYRPGTGPCYDCGLTEERTRSAQPSRQTVWPPAIGVAQPHAVIAATACITGHLAAYATVSLLTGAPQLATNHQFRWNLATLQDVAVLGPDVPSPHCPSCGPPG
jgi:molybdopterin/thiamine biosynthesis adenylyltransferase